MRPAPKQASPGPEAHLPYDIDVEQAILGAILVDNRIMDRIAGQLAAEQFYDPLHGRIFDFMARAYAAGEIAISPLTIHAALKADPGLVSVGGIAYLTGMAQGSPAIPNARDLARIIAELAIRRALIEAGQAIIDAAYTPPVDHPPKAQIAEAERAIDAISDAYLHSAGAGRSIVAAGDVMDEIIANVERHHRGEPVASISFGLGPEVDEITGGMQAGDLIIIMGRPGMGKSALLAGTALASAMGGRAELVDPRAKRIARPSLIFSLEMRSQRWMERTICDYDYEGALGDGARPMWYERFRAGRLSPAELERAVLARSEIGQFPIEICEDDSLSVHEIAARARAFAAQHPGQMGLIVVDYLQIVRPDDRYRGKREQEITEIARGLKSLAKRIGWPVVVGAQMNRQAESRNDQEKRPQLADLRESGSIENEADMIVGCYRPAYYIDRRKPAHPAMPEFSEWLAQHNEAKNKFEFHLLKNRNGRTTNWQLFCDIGSSAIRETDPAYRIGMARAPALDFDRLANDFNPNGSAQ